jgi:spermidine synthase
LPATAPQRLPRLSLALLSAAALSYEVLLTRLFAIIQWHHFAYMIISLALLGYGASGTFVSIAQRRLLPRFGLVYPLCLALFGISAVGCYLIAQQIPFHPEQLLWGGQHYGRLLLVYLLLALPFFFAATAVALALSQHKEAVPQLYAMDLLGAGVGSLGIIALLFAAHPMTVLQWLGGLGLLAALIGWQETGRRPAAMAGLVIILSLVLAGLPRPWLALQISPYKGLSQALQIQGTRVVDERSSPLGLLSVVDSPQVPWRHAPGLGLHADQEPLPQLAVFTDGGGMTVFTREPSALAELAYLDQMTSALPYHLQQPDRVLVLGAGGGSEVLQARYHGAATIDAVELNPQLVGLTEEAYGAFTGRPFSRQGVRVHLGEARGFVAGSQQRWDLIQLALLDSFGASSAGLYALSESYLYTTEAIGEYLDHLTADGQLAITRWVKLPPRDNLKLLATAITALEARGVSDADRRLVVIRGWQTATLVVKNAPFDAEELSALRDFCRSRGFDVAHYPGMDRDEANRHNILREPQFHDGARALLGEGREDFIDRYKFDLTPASDDRPYFNHFFRWTQLPELWQLRGEGGITLLEAGYLLLIATLVQALLVSLVLILLPLWLVRRQRQPVLARHGRGTVLLYFAAIGLAFLFLEIAFIQRFTLFLHHPLYAITTVLTAFLLFAGLGSAFSRRLAAAGRHRPGVQWAVIGILLIGLVYQPLLGPLFAALAALSLTFKILVSIVLIAPLAFCMGMPFPLALSALGRHTPSLIPWAWGVNGCASVLSAALATLLAIHLGFSTVLLIALALYLVAAWSIRSMACSEQAGDHSGS